MENRKNDNHILIPEEVQEFWTKIENDDFSFLDDEDKEPISDNPIIQEFYERYCIGCHSDKDYLKLEKDIKKYVRKHVITEEEDKAFSEFIESLVMMCDAIREGL